MLKTKKLLLIGIVSAWCFCGINTALAAGCGAYNDCNSFPGNKIVQCWAADSLKCSKGCTGSFYGRAGNWPNLVITCKKDNNQFVYLKCNDGWGNYSYNGYQYHCMGGL